MTVKNGAMFANIKFWDNTSGDYYSATLLVDTGAMVTTIRESVLKKLGCSISGEHVPIRTAIGHGSVLKATVAKLKLASFEFAGMTVHAHTFPDGCDFHGVLGMDILGRFNFGFDLDENIMELNMRGKV
jgi:predicted aspartyl protease